MRCDWNNWIIIVGDPSNQLPRVRSLDFYDTCAVVVLGGHVSSLYTAGLSQSKFNVCLTTLGFTRVWGFISLFALSYIEYDHMARWFSNVTKVLPMLVNVANIQVPNLESGKEVLEKNYDTT
eukprot:m.161286 g.161286  ORF g.161286 m.161286 type:complete len:122 (+) comp15185_c0_seq5:1267-1632(+)